MQTYSFVQICCFISKIICNNFVLMLKNIKRMDIHPSIFVVIDIQTCKEN